LKDCPHFSPATGCYKFHEKKFIKFKKIINLRKEIVEIQHTMNFLARLSTSYCTPFRRALFHMWVSIKRSTGFGSRLRTIICKRKLLLVKYINIKTSIFFEKIDITKTNLTICFVCETGARGNGNMNLHVIVFCTGLRPSHKILGRHVLNIFYPYSLRDVQRSGIPLNRYVSLDWKISFFSIFFDFLFPCLTPKNHATYTI